jgi:hypothetical protein
MQRHVGERNFWQFKRVMLLIEESMGKRAVSPWFVELFAPKPASSTLSELGRGDGRLDCKAFQEIVESGGFQ